MHLPQQVLDAGPSGYMREDFGERGIREGKQRVTRHIARDAAQASASCCMMDMCMRAHVQRWPDVEAPVLKTLAVKQHRAVDAGGSDGVQLHQLRQANRGHARDEVCCIELGNVMPCMHAFPDSPCLVHVMLAPVGVRVQLEVCKH